MRVQEEADLLNLDSKERTCCVLELFKGPGRVPGKTMMNFIFFGSLAVATPIP